MISHKYKCIFIHIQRTAGTHIERKIDDKDWWHDKALKKEKHLIASQARELYKDYWDEYFKFSIVRNPWARIVSCLKFPNHFGINQSTDGKINLADYIKKYNFPNTVEYDHRFHKATDIPVGIEGCGYQNILNEKLDFVATYENLKSDIEFIFNKIKLNKKFWFKEGGSQNYQKYFTEESRKEVEMIYHKDNQKYNYSF